jgi:hypothetical protein
LNHFFTSKLLEVSVLDPQDESDAEDDDGAAFSGAAGNPAIC